MPAQHIANQIGIPDFKQVVIYTGNVMRSVAGRDKPWNKKTNTELVQAISDTLYTSLQGPDVPSFRYYTETELLEVPDLRLSSRIHPDDRNEVDVTAKLFYLDGAYSNSHISQSIHHIKQLLNVDAIDTFIVSFNKESSVNEAWKDLEVYQQNGEIHKLGVSDFDCTTLKAFLEREDIKVKPAINQVHVEKCCSLPLDLIQLGKQQDIEMTFNSDTKDILDTNTFSTLLSNNGVTKPSTQILPRWVLKYDVFYRSRSIVADKGYIVVGDVSK